MKSISVKDLTGHVLVRVTNKNGEITVDVSRYLPNCNVNIVCDDNSRMKFPIRHRS